MSSYIPGAGLKKPTNQLENPVYPDIKKGPPRFRWSRKHWKVDEGQVMKQVEHIPQMQENAVLFQSRDYNSQHAYGKYPKFNKGQFVNLEFRPPMQDRDDILPLSRIPRPVVVPRINPGAAFSSGGSAFSQQNMGLSQVDKFITDRVKAGEVRPTFFAPITMPDDNSILPDLELKLPSYSAGAGFKFPAASSQTLEQNESRFASLDYNREQVSAIARANAPYTADAPDARSNMQFDYNRAQVSAGAGYNSQASLTGLTPVDLDLDYNRPQVSAGARERFTAVAGLTPVDFDLDYNRPQVSTGAGYDMSSIATYEGQDNIDHKSGNIEGRIDSQSEGGRSGSNVTPIYDMQDSERHGQGGVDRSMTDRKVKFSYVVPSNTYYEAPNTSSSDTPFYREKQRSISNKHGSFSTQGHIRRAGLDQPQIRTKVKKGY